MRRCSFFHPTVWRWRELKPSPAGSMFTEMSPPSPRTNWQPRPFALYCSRFQASRSAGTTPVLMAAVVSTRLWRRILTRSSLTCGRGSSPRCQVSRLHPPRLRFSKPTCVFRHPHQGISLSCRTKAFTLIPGMRAGRARTVHGQLFGFLEPIKSRLVTLSGHVIVSSAWPGLD